MEADMDKEHAEGGAEDLKGKAKEAAGKATGSRETEAEGKADLSRCAWKAGRAASSMGLRSVLRADHAAAGPCPAGAKGQVRLSSAGRCQVPIIIDEIGGSPERPPRPPSSPQNDKAEVEAASNRTLALLALARERDARLAPP